PPGHAAIGIEPIPQEPVRPNCFTSAIKIFEEAQFDGLRMEGSLSDRAEVLDPPPALKLGGNAKVADAGFVVGDDIPDPQWDKFATPSAVEHRQKRQPLRGLLPPALGALAP